MPPLTLLIKPASGACNLRCRYCFYHDVVQSRAEGLTGMMSQETGRSIIQQALAHARQSPITFGFQGGEPTLRGLDFFQWFARTVQEENRNNTPVSYTIQTNGTLLDESWIPFLRDNQVLVGVSLDGPQPYHDALRPDPCQQGSFQRVMDGVALLQRHDIPFNILCVLSDTNARSAPRLYRFFREHQLKFLQFIPLIQPFDPAEADGQPCLTPERFGRFLTQLFDLYYQDWSRDDYVSIRFFDNILLRMTGRMPESCDMGGHCSLQYVIEADGSVYPCDFYALDEHCMGNIRQSSFAELAQSPAAQAFLRPLPHTDLCARCPWRPFCPGRCRRYRDFQAGEEQANYYCRAFQDFFPYAYPRLRQMAAAISK